MKKPNLEVEIEYEVRDKDNKVVKKGTVKNGRHNS